MLTCAARVRPPRRRRRQYLGLLLASSDGKVIGAVFETLMALGRRGSSSLKRAERPTELHSRLFEICQNTSVKDAGVDLLSLASSGAERIPECERLRERGITVEFFREDAGSPCGGSMTTVRAGAAEFDGRGGDEAAACVDFCEARDIPTAQRFRVLSKLRLLNRICDREGRQTIVTMRLLAFTALIQGNPEHGTRGGARPQESAARTSPTRCARDAAGPRPPARRAL